MEIWKFGAYEFMSGKKGFNGRKHHCQFMAIWWKSKKLLMGQILAVSWGPQLIKLIECFCFLALLKALEMGRNGQRKE